MEEPSGVNWTASSKSWLLWAKSTSDQGRNPKIHLLPYHLLETAAVCRLLLERYPLWAKTFSAFMEIPCDQVFEWVPYLAFLHDIGKASPWFAYCRGGPWKDRISQDPLFPKASDGGNKIRHGKVTTCYVSTFFPALCKAGVLPQVSHVMCNRLARTLGGHHGLFITNPPRDLKEIFFYMGPVKDLWKGYALELMKGGLLWFKPVSSLPDIEKNKNVFPDLLAGLVCLSDWIASNESYFPYLSTPPKEEELPLLFEKALKKADDALDKAGFRKSTPPLPAPFESVFGKSPRALQSKIEEIFDRIPEGTSLPRLLIVEAPMGEGKTEAALLALDRWASLRGQNGAYVAMPTMATSNQMFSRVRDFLERRLPSCKENLHLLHSQALLSDEYEVLKTRAVAQDEDDPVDVSVEADEWFCASKRGLLSPFAVGTVDQALLAVLQTKHQFVRLFGLSGKTVLFDEVHAYDTYMLTIYLDLLRWLSACGATVVVLSATLPRSKREEMIKAFGEGISPHFELPSFDAAPYPRITILDGEGRLSSESFPARRDSAVSLAWWETGPDSLAETLKEELLGKSGGSVAWICNTVDSARQTYERLKEKTSGTGIDVMLFHARFQSFRRKEIEERVLDRFGPDRQKKYPNDRVILVATQVVEQSLDLDFDHLVTELAPMDLLLQRMGRLHRHESMNRPQSYATPTLRVLAPQKREDGSVDFGPSHCVYHDFFLTETWMALENRTRIALPGDVEPLVEAVYGKDLPSEEEREGWKRQQIEKLQNRTKKEEFEASKGLIPTPDDPDITTYFSQCLPEEEPFIAVNTRLGGPRISVVLLHTNGKSWFLDAAKTREIDKNPPKDPKERREWEKALIGNSVDLSYWGCLEDAQSLEAPWKKSALLKKDRLILLEGGQAWLNEREGRKLTLDEEKGVKVVFGKKEGGTPRESDV